MTDFIVIHSDNGDFTVVIEEGILSFKAKDFDDLKKFKDFKSTHKMLTGTGIKVGMTAIQAYQKNKTLTTKMFAKTALEKTFFNALAADLAATKKYKVKRHYSDGGIVYEIVRT